MRLTRKIVAAARVPCIHRLQAVSSLVLLTQ